MFQCDSLMYELQNCLSYKNEIKIEQFYCKIKSSSVDPFATLDTEEYLYYKTPIFMLNNTLFNCDDNETFKTYLSKHNLKIVKKDYSNALKCNTCKINITITK